jgi:transcriptional regulator with XRE-family HTH domain
MNNEDIREELREAFADPEYRHAYAASFLNTSIAAQIKALRDGREWTQEELGQHAGMRQESISRLENVNYSSWSISTLRRLAEAFDLALVVKFESFGNLLTDIIGLNREALLRPSFADDPAFRTEPSAHQTVSVPRKNRTVVNISDHKPTAEDGPLLPGKGGGRLIGSLVPKSYRSKPPVLPLDTAPSGGGGRSGSPQRLPAPINMSGGSAL